MKLVNRDILIDAAISAVVAGFFVMLRWSLAEGLIFGVLFFIVAWTSRVYRERRKSGQEAAP